MSSKAPVPQELNPQQKAAFDLEFKKHMKAMQDKLQADQSVSEDLANLRQLVDNTLPTNDQARYTAHLDAMEEVVNQKESLAAESAEEGSQAAKSEGQSPKFMTIMEKLMQLLLEAHQRYLNGEPFSPKLDQSKAALLAVAKNTWKQVKAGAVETRDRLIGKENLTSETGAEENPKLAYVRTEFQEVAKQYTNDDVAVRAAFDRAFNPNEPGLLNVTKKDFTARLEQATQEVADKLKNGREYQGKMKNIQPELQAAVFSPVQPTPTANVQAAAQNQQANRAATVIPAPSTAPTPPATPTPQPDATAANINQPQPDVVPSPRPSPRPSPPKGQAPTPATKKPAPKGQGDPNILTPVGLAGDTARNTIRHESTDLNLSKVSGSAVHNKQKGAPETAKRAEPGKENEYHRMNLAEKGKEHAQRLKESAQGRASRADPVPLEAKPKTTPTPGNQG